jgi:hypothetical protein
VSEAYWQGVLQSGMSVPQDKSLEDATAQLVEMLGHPSPRIREDLGYPILTAWISRGTFDLLLTGLGDGLVPGLSYGLGDDGDASVLRRSYSALMLAEVVRRDNDAQIVPRSSVLDWGDAATNWYLSELDHRGWIPELGWAQSIAHGADLLAALAGSRHLGSDELRVLLDVVSDRVLAPTSYIWRHDEDDRLAYAVMQVLHRNAVPLDALEKWLSQLGDGIRPPQTRGHVHTEWPSPSVRNTSAFLRALHLQLALGGDPGHPAHRSDLLLAVLEQIRAESPWLYRPTTRSRP